MTYFRQLPNVQYQSFLADKQSSQDYLLIKNLFRRCKIRDDLHSAFTIFYKYEIPDGYRPELVALDVYGSQEYEWVVIITSGITNIRDEWPLSNKNLYSYCERIYDDMNAVHHYETTEVRDEKNRLILPPGLIVNSNFSIPNPLLPTQLIYPTVSVSNYDYETKKNEEKRLIYILKPEYLSDVSKDMKRELFYDLSSQFIDEQTIKTENTYNTTP